MLRALPQIARVIPPNYPLMFRMNLSNTDLLDKSLAKISLNRTTTDCEMEEEFAWIDRIPESLQFAINM